MPLIFLEPKTKTVEDLLDRHMDVIRATLKGQVTAKWYGALGYDDPEEASADVIVDLLECIKRNADPVAADVVIYIRTNPNSKAEILSDDLLETLAIAWIAAGIGLTLRTEIWPQFLPGPWCAIEEALIADRVYHIEPEE